MAHARVRRTDEGSARLAAGIATLGALVLVTTDIVGSLLAPGYGPIRDSISDLAAGRLSWIQDTGLVAFAIGLLALAFGLRRVGEGPRGDPRLWSGGVVMVALLAVVVAIIALHDEYGDRDRGGFVFHIELVYTLGVLFGLATLLLARGLFARSRRMGAFDLAVAAAWIVGAPIYFFVPPGWDGAFERGLALLVLVWVLAMARLVAGGRGRVGLT
ncbi:DUF998 domain-containing protein [Salinarimonas ramus]|uniref:DUF998 domain-containing protein n=1 Tax=Salinarimonas ramus TaxID=690164 RepID=A0A917Q434_9HYPH|nr:DUF998 domain-containing protein [Salinarimonas ramus]GGK19640.1 hypothetical protein GCM10011322_02940 [Salinarimonas ramus]